MACGPKTAILVPTFKGSRLEGGDEGGRAWDGGGPFLRSTNDWSAASYLNERAWLKLATKIIRNALDLTVKRAWQVSQTKLAPPVVHFYYMILVVKFGTR
jgi:hypothetical protein